MQAIEIELEDRDVAEALEERADHIPEEVLRTGTATGDFFDRVHRALTARGLVLIVGPRGCGKTHMMRYTWLMCRDNPKLPLGIYVSFNRYYRLEPLLKTCSNAIELFHVWVLARIVDACYELVDVIGSAPGSRDAEQVIDFPRETLRSLIVKLERALPLSDDEETLSTSLSIGSLSSLINLLTDHYGRRYAVLLLDDAALTLTPEYLTEVFDIVRVLKSSQIAPKASVYPGTTEYGPRLHAQHEGQILPVWLSVEDAAYSEVMEDIASRRFAESSSIPPDVHEYLKYAAFGVPRAYLTMLREYRRGDFTTPQQGLNRIVEAHQTARLEEYRSLSLKLPRLDTLVRVGGKLLNAMVSSLKESNDELVNKDEKQIVVRIQGDDLKPILIRMISLLVEAGIVYEHHRVSHGPERTYRRYTPQIAALIAARAFSGRSR